MSEKNIAGEATKRVKVSPEWIEKYVDKMFVYSPRGVEGKEWILAHCRAPPEGFATTLTLSEKELVEAKARKEKFQIYLPVFEWTDAISYGGDENELREDIREEIRREKREADAIRVHLETVNSFDVRKDKGAYCAFLYKEGKGISREFIKPKTIWNENKVTYRRIWDFLASEGDVIEARLEGKNDYRYYYTIENGEKKEISKDEAFQRVLNIMEG